MSTKRNNKFIKNMNKKTREIRVALVGIGNCAGSLIEGIEYYKNLSGSCGLLFSVLGGYRLDDIQIVCGVDISEQKVGKKIDEAIYEKPNNFVRLMNIKVVNNSIVYRGPTLDGNPAHLKLFVDESKVEPVNVSEIFKQNQVDVVVNLLPTGSTQPASFADCLGTRSFLLFFRSYQ